MPGSHFHMHKVLDKALVARYNMLKDSHSWILCWLFCGIRLQRDLSEACSSANNLPGVAESHLYKNNDLANSLGSNGRKFVEKYYSRERMAADYIEVLSSSQLRS
jgi:glycosyltransferase involved in cell wall biosynthesis